MITNYFRPQNIEEALRLLGQPDTLALGGGTWLNQPHVEKFAVVDLQDLGLNNIRKVGNDFAIDACVTLQQLLESPDCPKALKQAIRLDSGMNIRSAATVAGSLVTSDGRSAFATVMLAMDAKITMTSMDTGTSCPYGDFLSLRPRNLITSISLPLNVRTAFETVARTPLDKPIVCAAVAQWASGRTRLALGGYEKGPLLAMDGTEAGGIDAAARNAFHEARDEWASSEYRTEVAATLAKRCLESVSSERTNE